MKSRWDSQKREVNLADKVARRDRRAPILLSAFDLKLYPSIDISNAPPFDITTNALLRIWVRCSFWPLDYYYL